jgi:hypothetical protein
MGKRGNRINLCERLKRGKRLGATGHMRPPQELEKAH